MSLMTREHVGPADAHRDQALGDPDGACWMHDGRLWTWEQAWHDIRRFAGALRAEGITRGDRIAYLGDNHPAILMAMHAVSMLGAADVVVQPSRAAGDEVAYILHDSEASLLFVGHELWDTFERIRDRFPALRTVVVGGDADELDAWLAAAEPLDRPVPGVSEHDPCLVLYSSGTTDRPKGTILSQHNLLVHIRNAFDHIEARAGDLFLLSRIMFHSCGLLAAHRGVPSVVVKDLRAPSLLEGLEAGATHAWVNPAAIIQLQQAGARAFARGARLRSVTYCAAPMPPAVLRDAMTAWPDTRFFHIYGMTEAVGTLTLHDHAADDRSEHPQRFRSAGRPIRVVEMRVVDLDTGHDVPPGQLGELWFRTEQAASGYLGDPVASAALLTTDGWLRSGDVGRVDESGFVYIEDRAKDVIITDGYNVGPAEVERVLAQHPAVLDSAVIGVPDEAWGEAVKAIVVCRPGTPPGAEELMAFARDRLGPHRTPTSVEFVDELPTNSLGKVVKRALRDPYWAGRDRPI